MHDVINKLIRGPTVHINKFIKIMMTSMKKIIPKIVFFKYVLLQEDLVMDIGIENP